MLLDTAFDPLLLAYSRCRLRHSLDPHRFVTFCAEPETGDDDRPPLLDMAPAEHSAQSDEVHHVKA